MYGEHNSSVNPSPSDSRRHRCGTERLRHSSAMPAGYRHGNEWVRDEAGTAMRPTLHHPKLFQGRERLRQRLLPQPGFPEPETGDHLGRMDTALVRPSVCTEPVRSTATEGGMASMPMPRRAVSLHPALGQGQAHGHTTDAGGTSALGTLGGRGRAGRTAVPARRLRDRLARSPSSPSRRRRPRPGTCRACATGNSSRSAISPACATFPRMPRASRSCPCRPPTVRAGF